MTHNTFAVLHNHHHCLNPEHFYHPTRKPCIHKQSLPISLLPIPRNHPSTILSVSIGLPIWTFQINGITQYVTFCIWLLPFSVIFTRLIHV